MKIIYYFHVVPAIDVSFVFNCKMHCDIRQALQKEKKKPLIVFTKFLKSTPKRRKTQFKSFLVLKREDVLTSVCFKAKEELIQRAFIVVFAN